MYYSNQSQKLFLIYSLKQFFLNIASVIASIAKQSLSAIVNATSTPVFTKAILAAIVLILLIFATIKIFNCKPLPNPDYPTTIVMHDTTTLIRYETKLQRDTIIKWYEKIIYKESKPTYIYYQKIDSIFIDKIKAYDFMLRVQKSGDKLFITAVNLDGHILKEYIYDNVSDNFTAVSKDSAIYVKSKIFEYEGISLAANYSLCPVSFPQVFSGEPYQSLSLGLRTNFTLFNKLNITPFIGINVLPNTKYQVPIFNFQLTTSLKLF